MFKLQNPIRSYEKNNQFKIFSYFKLQRSQIEINKNLLNVALRAKCTYIIKFLYDFRMEVALFLKSK